MLDRHLLGDLSLAVLVALPLASLAYRPPVNVASATAPAAKVSVADRAPGSGRIGLLG
jgi:hypothetical protein